MSKTPNYNLELELTGHEALRVSLRNGSATLKTALLAIQARIAALDSGEATAGAGQRVETVTGFLFTSDLTTRAHKNFRAFETWVNELADRLDALDDAGMGAYTLDQRSAYGNLAVRQATRRNWVSLDAIVDALDDRTTAAESAGPEEAVAWIFTFTDNPADGDTITVNERVYTFVAAIEDSNSAGTLATDEVRSIPSEAGPTKTAVSATACLFCSDAIGFAISAGYFGAGTAVNEDGAITLAAIGAIPGGYPVSFTIDSTDGPFSVEVDSAVLSVEAD